MTTGKKKKYPYNRGFTLIELMVVTAIISLMASLAIFAFGLARERAYASSAAAQIQELRKAITLYRDDTRTIPVPCRLDCLQSPSAPSPDPFLNALGVPGWTGPYLRLWNLTHPWGGHIGFTGDEDWDGDSVPDVAFIFDDDAPGTDASDNSGFIPTAALQKIDETIDDGNLSTGRVRGDGQDPFTAPGELVVLF